RIVALLEKQCQGPHNCKMEKNPKIAECYRLLFETNSENVFWISAIAKTIFSEVAVPTLTSEHCTFALVVCDIFLNPKSKSIICDKKNMKLHIEKYLVYICHFLYFFYCTIF